MDAFYLLVGKIVVWTCAAVIGVGLFLAIFAFILPGLIAGMIF